MKRTWIPFEGTTHKRPTGQFPVSPVGLKSAYNRGSHRGTNLHLERSHPRQLDSVHARSWSNRENTKLFLVPRITKVKWMDKDVENERLLSLLKESG